MYKAQLDRPHALSLSLSFLAAAACGGQPTSSNELPEDTSEEALLCQPRTAPLDPRRSLFVTDVATLTGADFSLARTLDQLARQTGNRQLTGLQLFRQLWDTYPSRGPG